MFEGSSDSINLVFNWSGILFELGKPNRFYPLPAVLIEPSRTEQLLAMTAQYQVDMLGQKVFCTVQTLDAFEAMV
jgi:hypothetical protein